MNRDQLKALMDKKRDEMAEAHDTLIGELDMQSVPNGAFAHYFSNGFYSGYKAGHDSLAEIVIEVVGALEFYANGGNFNFDLWEHKELGHFTGKSARQALDRVYKKMEAK